MGFRDRAPEFAALGVEVLGASYDPPAANAAFADKYGFGFRLLSDTERAVGPSYGAAHPPDHPYAAWAKRVTVVIAPDGTVAKTYEVKDAAAHPDEVLADLRELVDR